MGQGMDSGCWGGEGGGKGPLCPGVRDSALVLTLQLLDHSLLLLPVLLQLGDLLLQLHDEALHCVLSTGTGTQLSKPHTLGSRPHSPHSPVDSCSHPIACASQRWTGW